MEAGSSGSTPIGRLRKRFLKLKPPLILWVVRFPGGDRSRLTGSFAEAPMLSQTIPNGGRNRLKEKAYVPFGSPLSNLGAGSPRHPLHGSRRGGVRCGTA